MYQGRDGQLACHSAPSILLRVSLPCIAAATSVLPLDDSVTCPKEGGALDPVVMTTGTLIKMPGGIAVTVMLRHSNGCGCFYTFCD